MSLFRSEDHIAIPSTPRCIHAHPDSHVSHPMPFPSYPVMTHFFFLSNASIFSSRVPRYLLSRSTALCRACMPPYQSACILNPQRPSAPVWQLSVTPSSRGFPRQPVGVTPQEEARQLRFNISPYPATLPRFPFSLFVYFVYPLFPSSLFQEKKPSATEGNASQCRLGRSASQVKRKKSVMYV